MNLQKIYLKIILKMPSYLEFKLFSLIFLTLTAPIMTAAADISKYFFTFFFFRENKT